jgi:hypothetical protein
MLASDSSTNLNPFLEPIATLSDYLSLATISRLSEVSA